MQCRWQQIIRAIISILHNAHHLVGYCSMRRPGDSKVHARITRVAVCYSPASSLVYNTWLQAINNPSLMPFVYIHFIVRTKEFARLAVWCAELHKREAPKASIALNTVCRAHRVSLSVFRVSQWPSDRHSPLAKQNSLSQAQHHGPRPTKRRHTRFLTTWIIPLSWWPRLLPQRQRWVQHPLYSAVLAAAAALPALPFLRQ